MSTTFFSAVAPAVANAKQRITVDIEGLGEGRIKVLLSANLGPTPEKATDAEAALRAALAKPLVVAGTPAEVEAALLDRVTHHVQAVNEGSAMLEQIRSLGAQAIAAVQKPATKPAAPVEASDEDDDEAGDSQPPAAEHTQQPAAPAPFDNLAASF
ncbi:PRTRC system protein E [Pseudomonas sp. DP-17]|uniref:PRTRC system protein E n=1 Tax=Pseudomonas sp. DP-17 TaxID=1580486 RepID=UPI001EFB26FF|nr:PRTRC system protein E [Pseudomonas sp. DP-17]MCG8911015.1 PRTRC system protein E [Pseudomonas sp. DP-17]